MWTPSLLILTCGDICTLVMALFLMAALSRISGSCKGEGTHRMLKYLCVTGAEADEKAEEYLDMEEDVGSIRRTYCPFRRRLK
mmetsp:Transcript_16935/g.24331  ORF Transcript_16935/g.24331 Transcript_16935/m.24331 type:complete len:83 (+) Transcript_16935:225-473(+)